MTTGGRVSLRYVALGDSYTIGTAVDPAASWPAQLVASLGVAGGSGRVLELVANLGVNGCTSDELRRDQLPELDRLRPDFVSLLIGVNDVVRGIPAAAYETSVKATLLELLERLSPDRVVTVAIPDYTVTPRGGDYGDPERQSRAIAGFNAIMAGVSRDLGVRFVDIFDLSLRAVTDRTLVAADGLHPSGAQYGLWVERITPVVTALLGGAPADAQSLPRLSS